MTIQASFFRFFKLAGFFRWEMRVTVVGRMEMDIDNCKFVLWLPGGGCGCCFGTTLSKLSLLLGKGRGSVYSGGS